ncbi:hypothetical protein [Kosakonia arachidis]|uniref:hypothetical protein n=1 Tax=Kosakonia arachidis TaxID=551989 RepID=UPI000B7C6224|nr:hypothetical protein [Kosakonia arachidis]
MSLHGYSPLTPEQMITRRDNSLFEFLAFWMAKHPNKISHRAECINRENFTIHEEFSRWRIKDEK